MRHLEPPRPPSRDQLRAFAWTVGTAFVLLGALLAWRGRLVPAAVSAGAGLLLALAGLVVPRRLAPVHRAWMALAVAMSRVTTPLLMSVVYFAVLTPIALVRRLLGRNALVRPRGAPTHWIPRPPSERRSDLRRQF